jgi:hypothetical protein
MVLPVWHVGRMTQGEGFFRPSFGMTGAFFTL